MNYEPWSIGGRKENRFAPLARDIIKPINEAIHSEIFFFFRKKGDRESETDREE